MPYLTWLATDCIRVATRNAVVAYITELRPQISEKVKATLQAEEFANALVKGVLLALDDSWKIDVNIEPIKGH